jgi:hypothetical protein
VTSSVTHRIDASDRIVSVGGDWTRFALENGGPAAEAVLGTVLWDSFSEIGMVDVWQRLVARARAGVRVSVPARCDAPSVRRSLRIDVMGGSDGGVTFVSETISSVDRKPVVLLDPRTPRTSDTVLSCAWCHAVRVHGGWVPIETAASDLGLVDRVSLPRVTHGICDRCEIAVGEAMGGPAAG